MVGRALSVRALGGVQLVGGGGPTRPARVDPTGRVGATSYRGLVVHKGGLSSLCAWDGTLCICQSLLWAWSGWWVHKDGAGVRRGVGVGS